MYVSRLSGKIRTFGAGAVPEVSYLGAALLVGAATLLGFVLRNAFALMNLAMAYLFVSVVSALAYGRGPSIFASILGVLAFDFFLVPPMYTLAVDDSQYVITFVGLLFVSLVVSALASRSREREDFALRREAEIRALYEFTRDLSGASANAAPVIAERARRLFGRDAGLYLPDETGAHRLVESTEGFWETPDFAGTVEWSAQHRAPCGRWTDAFAPVEATFLPLCPLSGADTVAGVLALSGGGRSPFERETKRLLDAFLLQAAAALDRERLAAAAREGEIARERERLQGALLSSISHEFRTPLATITGVLSALREAERADGDFVLPPEDRRELLDSARNEAARLNRLVGNLLGMSRIEAGRLTLRLCPTDLRDVVDESVENLRGAFETHPVSVRCDCIPIAPVDPGLMELVVSNLLENAARYSPDGSPIDVTLRGEGRKVVLDVADRGKGIPAQHRERIFEKFYRIGDGDGGGAGTGLGLSICKAVTEAHGGTVEAFPRDGGGTVFRVALPAYEEAEA